MIEVSQKDQAPTLPETLRRGFLLCQKGESRTLGDRTSYIGMSELARYSECPRAAVAAKLSSHRQSGDKIIPLQRGHWFEQGVGEALDALGLDCFWQLEIAIREKESPLRAHLDFTLVWDGPKPALRILEVKSTEKIPAEPRDAHRFQAQGQICLLADYWDKPVFGLPALDLRGLTFPEICAKQLKLSLPKDPDEVSLECWLVYLSMRDCKVFGPYVREPSLTGEIISLAESFWASFKSCEARSDALSALDCAKGFQPLCATCLAAANCPRFTDSAFLPQWEPAIEKLALLKKRKCDLEQEIRETEDALKQVYRQSGEKDWLATGKHRFRLAEVRGRQSLDTEMLLEELAAIFEGYGIEQSLEDIFRNCCKVGAPYERLTINPIN